MRIKHIYIKNTNLKGQYCFDEWLFDTTGNIAKPFHQLHLTSRNAQRVIIL